MKKEAPQHSLHYNFIMNFLLSASAILFPLMTFPYVSRVLLDTGTGKVAFATSLISYFMMIAMLGIPTYGIRAVAQAREDPLELKAVVQELLVINLVMTVVAYGLFGIALFLVPKMAAQKTLMIVCSAAILLNTLSMNWFFQGMEQYTWITTVSLLFKVISVVTMILFVHSPADDVWYGVMTVLSSYGAGFVSPFRVPGMLSAKPVRRQYGRHFKPVLIFFAMTVATTIYTYLDTAMLGFMKDYSQVGLYNAAIKIKTLLIALITSLGAVLLPRMAALIAQGQKEDFARLTAKAISFVLLFSVPVCVYCMVYAPDILDFLSGPVYVPAAGCMRILMPAIVLIGLSNITGIQVLVPLNREKEVLISVAAGALLDFGLNLLLIPRFSASGAAAGTLCAEILVLTIQVWFLRRELAAIWKKAEWCILLKSMGVFVLVCAACRIWIHLPVFWNLLLAGLLCFGIYGLLLLLFKEEILTGFLQGRIRFGSKKAG